MSLSTEPVSLASPWRWLRLGWADLCRNPLPGLVHGLLVTAFGALLLWLARDRFWLLAGAFSGFLIVAPIVATGLYAVSRELQAGRRIGMPEVMALWRSREGRLVRFGLLLGLAGTGWVLTSAGLITLWSPAPILKPADFFRHVVLVKEVGLFEVWILVGSLLAAPVFALDTVKFNHHIKNPKPLALKVKEEYILVIWYSLVDFDEKGEVVFFKDVFIV